MEQFNCGKHGVNNIVVCCQHLSFNKKSEQAFIVPEDGDDEAMIWCGTCEAARLKDLGWYDTADAIADWKLICASCLDEMVALAKQVTDIEGERTSE